MSCFFFEASWATASAALSSSACCNRSHYHSPVQSSWLACHFHLVPLLHSSELKFPVLPLGFQAQLLSFLCLLLHPLSGYFVFSCSSFEAAIACWSSCRESEVEDAAKVRTLICEMTWSIREWSSLDYTASVFYSSEECFPFTE